MFRQLAQTPASDLLVQLRQLARDDSFTFAQHFVSIFETCRKPVRRFVEDQRAGHCAQFVEPRTPRSRTGGQEAAEEKLICR